MENEMKNHNLTNKNLQGFLQGFNEFCNTSNIQDIGVAVTVKNHEVAITFEKADHRNAFITRYAGALWDQQNVRGYELTAGLSEAAMRRSDAADIKRNLRIQAGKIPAAAKQELPLPAGVGSPDRSSINSTAPQIPAGVSAPQEFPHLKKLLAESEQRNPSVRKSATNSKQHEPAGIDAATQFPHLTALLMQEQAKSSTKNENFYQKEPAPDRGREHKPKQHFPALRKLLEGSKKVEKAKENWQGGLIAERLSGFLPSFVR